MVKRERTVGRLRCGSLRQTFERALGITRFHERKPKPVTRRRRVLVVWRDFQKLTKPISGERKFLLVERAPSGIEHQ